MGKDASKDPVVGVCEKELDPTLLRRSVRRTLEVRVLSATELQRPAQEAREAGHTERRSRRPVSRRS